MGNLDSIQYLRANPGGMTLENRRRTTLERKKRTILEVQKEMIFKVPKAMILEPKRRKRTNCGERGCSVCIECVECNALSIGNVIFIGVSTTSMSHACCVILW